MYNQGVILWNAGKVADAKKQFEGGDRGEPEPRRSALSARHGAGERGQPRPAPATEFETYLKLAPTGPNAATAKGILGTIKK